MSSYELNHLNVHHISKNSQFTFTHHVTYVNILS